MNAHRVLTEARRQLLRGSTLRLSAGFALLVGLGALYAAHTGSFEALANVPYLFAPTLVCPIAAYRILSDRDTGLADVHTTTPLTRSESLVATSLSVIALTPLAVLASLPVTWASLVATASGAPVDLAAYPLWAVSIGTTAACVGLLVGHLKPGSPRLGVGLAFGVVLVWLFFGLAFGETPNPPVVFTGFRRLSPLSYAIQAVDNGPLLVGPAILGLLPLTLAVWALGLLVPVAFGLQHASGWHRPRRSRLRALAVAIVLLVLGAAALLPWSAPTVERTDHHDEATGYHGSDQLWVSTDLNPFGLPDPPLTQGVDRHVQLKLVGEPNATVGVQAVDLQSELVDFQRSDELPRRVVLDHIVADDERRVDQTGGQVGTATLNLTFQAYPQRIFNQAPTTLTVTIDGHMETHQLDMAGRYWEVDSDPVILATAGTVVPLVVGARWLPRRRNGW